MTQPTDAQVWTFSITTNKHHHTLSLCILKTTDSVSFLSSSALLALLFAAPAAHAQVGSANGWSPAHLETGVSCWTIPGGSSVVCSTPQDACDSWAIFYALGGPVNYAYVFPTQAPVFTLQGQWVSGLSCAYHYTGNFIVGLSTNLPSGFTGDSNNTLGYSPSGPGRRGVFKQVKHR